MIPWALFILVIDILMFASILNCSCEMTWPIILCVATAVGAFGIIIRTISKIKAGRYEKLNQELSNMRSENKELLERIADIREQQIMERTDKDLI